MGKPFFYLGCWLVFICSISLFSAPRESRANASDNILRFGYHVRSAGELDPHFAAASQKRVLADMIFNGLLRYVPGQAPKIEPDLARAIPEFYMDKKKQVWTIYLRKGVMFHPGPETPPYELTADDVVYSLNKSADSGRCAYAGGYTGMTVKKTGMYTVEIIMDKPVSPILFFPKLANYGGGFIVSKKALEAMGDEKFKTHPVGTGPFMFKQHLPHKKVVLTAHTRYFRGAPKLAGVEFHLLPDLADREAGLKKGSLDIIAGSGKKGWIDATKKKKGIIVDTHGVGEVFTIHLNTRLPPLDNIHVRKAIAYALGRQDFVTATDANISGPAFSPVPVQFLPGGLTRNEVRTYKLDYARNPEKAKMLLAKAGCPDGMKLDLVSSEKRSYRTNYEVLKKQLAEVGIICNIRVVPHKDMHKIIRKEPKHIVIYGAWRPNADAYLTRFFHSDSIVVTGKKPDTNFSHYDKIDDLIQAARFEIDPDKQINLWQQAQIRILSDMAALPVTFILQNYARHNLVDYGHPLNASMALYPQFTENTRFKTK